MAIKTGAEIGKTIERAADNMRAVRERASKAGVAAEPEPAAVPRAGGGSTVPGPLPSINPKR